MKWRWLLLLVFAALFFAVSCGAGSTRPGADDPIATLASHREATDLGRAFWLPLASAHDPLWFDALGLCRLQQPARPNCRIVLRLHQALQVPGFEESDR